MHSAALVTLVNTLNSTRLLGMSILIQLYMSVNIYSPFPHHSFFANQTWWLEKLREYLCLVAQNMPALEDKMRDPFTVRVYQRARTF